MRRESRERFPRHRLQRKPLVSDPGMHHGTCVTHVTWCMSGSLTRVGGENIPGIPGACATRNFTYLVRGPLPDVVCGPRHEILYWNPCSPTVYQCITYCMRVCRCRLNAWEMIMCYYTCALYSKNLVVCRRIRVMLVIVIVSLMFQKIVWATCPHISSSTCCMFWPPAWWTLRLHWWPLAERNNASMYLVLISTNVCVPVSLLYSAWNKTYYHYFYRSPVSRLLKITYYLDNTNGVLYR